MLVIESLGGSVPDVGGGKDYRRRAIRACFNELQRIVGPHTDKVVYNDVLDNGTCLLPFWEVRS